MATYELVGIADSHEFSASILLHGGSGAAWTGLGRLLACLALASAKESIWKTPLPARGFPELQAQNQTQTQALHHVHRKRAIDIIYVDNKIYIYMYIYIYIYIYV